MIKTLFTKIKKIFSFNNEDVSNTSPQFRLRYNGSSVFDYNFLMNLKEQDYPKYLSQSYYIKFGQKLNLRHPKTINEKIQWLKLYDNIPMKTLLSDKVLVRDWVKEKIGEKYIKPILWTGNNFNDIPFNSLPDNFIIKANHGCSWNIFIKDKNKFLLNEKLFQYTKEQIDGWMDQSFFGWSDFETQYKKIKPQIIIEPIIGNKKSGALREIEIWCFNSDPKIFQNFPANDYAKKKIVSTYDENFENIDLKFLQNCILNQEAPDDKLKEAVELSKILANGFKLVRIDWIVDNNNLYFGEMTFTPQSGYIVFPKEYENWNLKLGKMLKLKGE